MKQDINRFDIGDHHYAVRTLSPDKAIPFGLKISQIVAPLVASLALPDSDSIVKVLGEVSPEKIVPVLEETRKYMIVTGDDGKDILFSNPARFNAWFSEYPEELFPAQLRAAWELAKDFFPRTLLTALKEAQSKALLRAAEGLASTSRKDANPPPFSPESAATGS
jgi:hypothetical protein